MHKPLLKHLLITFLLLMPLAVGAAGLGRLTILSTLGHPLLAEIELISVQKDELASLTVRLASADAYRQANLQYGPALTGLRLTVETRPNGQHYIKVVSTRPVNEPYLDLLIELHSASGRLVREYTGLIDPPGYTPPQTVAAAPPAAEPRPVAPPKPPVAVPAPAAAPVASREYGPVKRGETLSKIAVSVKPEGVSLEQMLVAIFRDNPEAFMNNNMNLMKAGAKLRIPDKDQVAALTRREAAKEVRAQTGDWNQYRRRLADTAAPVSERKPAESKRETMRVKVEDKAAGAKDKHVLRLSPGEPPKGAAGAERVRALEEELIARERELSEANLRIKELEKAVKGSAK